MGYTNGIAPWAEPDWDRAWEQAFRGYRLTFRAPDGDEWDVAVLEDGPGVCYEIYDGGFAIEDDEHDEGTQYIRPALEFLSQHVAGPMECVGSRCLLDKEVWDG